MMKGNRILFFVLLFTAIHASSVSALESHKGILNLQNHDFNLDGNVTLKGEWFFLWDTLITSFDQISDEDTSFMNLPRAWEGYIVKGKKIPGQGVASYGLRIILPKNTHRLSIYLREVNSSCRLFCNNTLIHSEGIVGRSRETSKPSRVPRSLVVYPLRDTIDLLLQVSNYYHRTGSVFESPVIGTTENIVKQRSTKLFYDLFLFGSMFLMAFYHLLLFFMNKKEKYALYFSICTFMLAIRTIITGENFALYFFEEMSWELAYKLEYITFYLYIPFFSLFLHSLYPKQFTKKVVKGFVVFGFICAAVVLIPPTRFYSHTLSGYEIIAIFVCLYFMFGLIRTIINKNYDAVFFLIGVFVLSASMVNDIMYWRAIWNTILLVPIGTTIFILLQSIVLSIRFIRNINENEKLSTQLKFLNENLSHIVEERTEVLLKKQIELEKQTEVLRSANSEIIAINDEITRQNDILEGQNKKISAGIQTAEAIQKTLLPPPETLNILTKENFILYYPRDVVSGDFYWFKNYQVHHKPIMAIAVGDCTGHGIPGAFLSTFGLSFLNEFFNNTFNVIHPHLVLEEMRRKMKEVFHQSFELSQRESIDISLLIFNAHDNTIEYSGANAPAYIVRKMGKSISLIELKPQKNPIGIYYKEQPFQNQYLSIEPGDILYMFSDGFITQLGGSKEKRFLTKNFKELLMSVYDEPLQTQQMIIQSKLNEWKGFCDQTDDITVVGIKLRAS